MSKAVLMARSKVRKLGIGSFRGCRKDVGEITQDKEHLNIEAEIIIIIK